MDPVTCFSMEKKTLENTFWRRVIFDSESMQVVLMSLPSGSTIDLEIHETTTQLIRVEKGELTITIYNTSKEPSEEVKLSSGTNDTVIIPPGVYHKLTNSSKICSAKLYTVYSPPTHKPGTIQRFKP